MYTAPPRLYYRSIFNGKTQNTRVLKAFTFTTSLNYSKLWGIYTLYVT